MTDSPPYVPRYLTETRRLLAELDFGVLEHLVFALAQLRDRQGRLAFLGVGGSAANASHAVNDFRKLCHIDAMTPTDNVAELTARTNDDGWDRTFVDWLTCSQWGPKDAIFVLSVGGGTQDASPNLIHALTYARTVGARMMGIVGQHGGETARLADPCLILPTTRTPQVESLQSVILHLLVNHPALSL